MAVTLGAWETIYAEALVPAYDLPDPLVGPGGTRIHSPEAGWAQRRPEIVMVFDQPMYSRMQAVRQNLAGRVSYHLRLGAIP